MGGFTPTKCKWPWVRLDNGRCFEIYERDPQTHRVTQWRVYYDEATQVVRAEFSDGSIYHWWPIPRWAWNACVPDRYRPGAFYNCVIRNLPGVSYRKIRGPTKPRPPKHPEAASWVWGWPP